MNAPARFPEQSPAPQVTRVGIDFTIGARRLVSVPRALSTWRFALGDVLAGPSARLSPPAPGPDGLRVLSAPSDAVPAILAHFADHLVGSRQDYPRHYIDMGEEGAPDFAAYMARFSGKTRSTLRRKAKKLAAEPGGYEVSEHRSPAEVERFLDLALPLSARTYQARLLDAGLPDTPEARRAMLEAAEDGRMRGFLLHAGESRAPVAYLSLPVEGRVLVYAHLGYDPDFARLSPGTVLQMEALERLYAEERFTHFDFTEGDGAHKAMFATHSAPCASFVLLAPGMANRALLAARGGFDAGVAGAKALAARSGLLARARAGLRG
ncbi:GNAT family N-acetyltransferase [Erythrobacter sp.]|uniref:GNAT family N-acetyltransferase n=1 Tax=Erythrobacter sp. TaxID=1042 RepID=UPI00142600D0|nr:GNAT family N-acetyltransferase [Erythrobacter sp.]QIQ87044.1 MAG: GNAT family N-acetyltransferase [Erythrobacter sp.]